jgi:L-rhamnose isomerase
MYLDSDTPVPRNEIQPKRFDRGWAEWASTHRRRMVFNPLVFGGTRSRTAGFSPSQHHDQGVRNFWIGHRIASREVGPCFGQTLGRARRPPTSGLPDGYRDTPADRLSPRRRLRDALDKVFEQDLNPLHNLDAVECKLFGIGLSEKAMWLARMSFI